MNACSHLFVCKGVSQRSSKRSSVSCNCCVLDCSSEFFCTYVGQKPEVSRSVLLFPSVCWGVVGAGGFLWVLGWKGRSLFATGPVAQWMWRCLCSLGAPQKASNSMVGGSTPPWSAFILGLRCDLVKFCGLEVASDLL